MSFSHQHNTAFRWDNNGAQKKCPDIWFMNFESGKVHLQFDQNLLYWTEHGIVQELFINIVHQLFMNNS